MLRKIRKKSTCWNVLIELNVLIFQLSFSVKECGKYGCQNNVGLK